MVNLDLVSKGTHFMKLLAPVAAMTMLFGSAYVAAASDSKATQQPPQGQVDLSQPLTLEKAIQIGLQNQPTLYVSKSQLEASRARETQSKASYYPSVAPTFDYSNPHPTINGQTGNFEQRITQIGARQLIFDTFKREENVLASRWSRKANEFSVLDTRQVIISNVSTSYYELLRRRELVKV